MKESISYTFLLNIVIVFIFVCFAIIMGVLSYYKAFRANTAIIESIEKYEGYNCASINEIKRKLSTIGYKTPFNTSCNGKDTPCATNNEFGYVISSYNITGPSESEGVPAGNDALNSYASTTGKKSTKYYQYGVYTYMYVDLPVVSGMLRIPLFSKTNIMYEFRDLAIENTGLKDVVYDERMKPENFESYALGFIGFGHEIGESYAKESVGGTSYFLNINSNGYSARERAKIDVNDDGSIMATDGTIVMSAYDSFYSKYSSCEQTKIFENY